MASKGSGNHSAQHRAEKSNFHSHPDYQLARPWLGVCVHTHACTHTHTPSIPALPPSPCGPGAGWTKGLDKSKAPYQGSSQLGVRLTVSVQNIWGACIMMLLMTPTPTNGAEAQGVGSGSCSVIKRKKEKDPRPRRRDSDTPLLRLSDYLAPVDRAR